MKTTICIFALAIWVAVVSSVQAASLLSEVTPTQPKAAGFTINVTCKRVADGTVKFRVVISENEVTFSSKPGTGLGIVKVMDHSSSITGGRPIPSTRQDHSIACVFTLAEASLDDPDFCFVFTNYVERVVNGKLISMPSSDFIYARLRDFTP